MLTRSVLHYTSEAEWLAARAQDLTSTEIAALFGCSPYTTEYELHFKKGGELPADDFTANERMKWGNRLETAIALGIAEDHGLIVDPFKCYIRIPELRLGSSFDFKIVGLAEGYTGPQAMRDMFREHGPGIMEVKNVDGLAFRRTWIEDGETIEAPPHIEFQAQHQLEVADLNWSVIAPLVGGNTPKPIIRVRDLDVCAAIRERATAFWQRRDAGTPPAPDFTKDGDTIAALYAKTGDAELDMRDNNRLVELCMVRKQAADTIKEAEKVKDAATAEILTIIGEAKKVTAAGGFTISASTIAPKWIEAYERKGYRTLRIAQKAA